MILELEAIKHLLLHEWDPIGVSGIEGAEDEYDTYAFQVFTSLHQGATVESLTAYLEWLVVENMGMSSKLDHNRAIATKAMTLHRDGDINVDLPNSQVAIAKDHGVWDDFFSDNGADMPNRQQPDQI